MTSFALGETGNPDWQRTLQFTGDVMIDADHQVVAGAHTYPLIYVGDSPSVGVEVVCAPPAGGWSVQLLYVTQPPLSGLVGQQEFQGTKAAVVFDVVGNIAPFLRVQLGKAGGGGPCAFTTTLWKSQVPPAAGAGLAPGPLLVQEGITVHAHTSQEFYTGLVSRLPSRYWFSAAGGATSVIELFTVDQSGTRYLVGATDRLDPYGNAVGWGETPLGLFQGVVKMTNNGAGDETFTATILG